jgi:hypothetical protein
MGCGCGGKKTVKKATQATSVRSKAGGNRNRVRLGLKSYYPLPFKFSRAIDGRDVIVLANNIRISSMENAIVIVGRNALVNPEHKSQLVAKWPHVFE